MISVDMGLGLRSDLWVMVGEGGGGVTREEWGGEREVQGVHSDKN